NFEGNRPKSESRKAPSGVGPSCRLRPRATPGRLADFIHPGGFQPAQPTPEAAERQANSYTSVLARGMPSIVQERDYENKIAGSDFTRGSVFVRQDARLNW